MDNGNDPPAGIPYYTSTQLCIANKAQAAAFGRL